MATFTANKVERLRIKVITGIKEAIDNAWSEGDEDGDGNYHPGLLSESVAEELVNRIFSDFLNDESKPKSTLAVR